MIEKNHINATARMWPIYHYWRDTHVSSKKAFWFYEIITTLPAFGQIFETKNHTHNNNK